MGNFLPKDIFNSNNNNASISIAQNKLSLVALMAVQTNMSLVLRQNSAEDAE